MAKKNNITRNDITTNTTPVVLTDARRPWARTAASADPWVVGPDGTVVRRSDLLGRDTDSWDTRR